jgi:dihydrofolate synthase/folylpolyglutamate synthase
MDIEKHLNKLFSLHTFGVKLGLNNMRQILTLLGQPQNKLKTIHIAGSNGKGSTAAFIASMLQEMKFRIGLYTSPHFVSFNERIKINGKEIPDEKIARFIEVYERNIDMFKLTFFEATTAMAFKYFHDEKVDYAVIETGLGGRLDATNLIKPLSAVITSISLEHTEILGDTIEKIAEEKAGIIKERCNVFIGKLPDEAEDVIEQKCKQLNCELYKLDDYITEKNDSLELYTEELELDEWIMPLKGKYQKYNAALASLVVSKTLNNDNFRVVENGIKNVITNTGLQGRYEFYNSKPDIIFDSAHNPEGVFNFLSEFKGSKGKYSKTVLLFGVMKDKAIKEMMMLFNDSFDEINVTEIAYERACSIDELKEVAEQLNINVGKISNPAEYVLKFREEESSKCLVVLGSMYLLGYIKSQLERINVS